jgi:hypothetical protein
MALIQCPECKKEVSTAANACVHCGHPLQKEQPQKIVRVGGRSELIGFLLILAAILSPWFELGKFGILLGVIGFGVFLAGRFK